MLELQASVTGYKHKSFDLTRGEPEMDPDVPEASTCPSLPSAPGSSWHCQSTCHQGNRGSATGPHPQILGEKHSGRPQAVPLKYS